MTIIIEYEYYYNNDYSFIIMLVYLHGKNKYCREVKYDGKNIAEKI